MEDGGNIPVKDTVEIESTNGALLSSRVVNSFNLSKATAMSSTNMESDGGTASIGSPYTTLGSSGTSTYNSIVYSSMRNNSRKTRNLRSNSLRSNYDYLSLKAKAEEGHAKHESRTKAVMDALQSLQSKIRRIESDRSQAEINLKCLAIETKDYKELLKQKNALAETSGCSRDFSSRELEAQLDHAQGRCQVLEKQLDSMRKVMQSQPKMTISESSFVPVSVQTVSPISEKSTQKSFCDTEAPDSPAIVKINDLEREHERLTATQSQTEDKISKLEEKIREEEYQRKLLQDKTKELQNVVERNKELMDIENTTQPEKKHKMKKRRPSRIATTELKATPQASDKTQSSNRNHSPSHCLVDFASIPFVVGQSTAKSHSLGANIQNVLSIMKSHNMLCCNDTQKSSANANRNCKPKKCRLLASCKHLQDLLTALQDEFAQLGFEHRDVVSQLRSAVDETSINRLEKEKKKLTERMETKAGQINVIRDHLEKTKETEKARKKLKKKKENKSTVKKPDHVDIVNIVRRTGNKSPEVKTNVKLDMYKKVQKLQSTLRKDDLKWE